MSAAAASLLMITVDLADKQAGKVKRRARVGGWLLGWPVRVLEGSSLWMLRKGMRSLLVQTASVRGLSAMVRDTHDKAVAGAGVTGKEAHAIARLEAAGGDLRELHTMVMGLTRELESPRLLAATREMAATASDLYEALTELRWEVMELEATRSIRTPGCTATTPEEADALFARLISE